jgi:hypothetical protein
MAFREVRVYEVREVLRLWLDGEGFRSVERLSAVDRKTVRRYVTAAEGLGLVRGGGVDQLGDEFIASVVEVVRPHRSDGHGDSWQQLVGEQVTVYTPAAVNVCATVFARAGGVVAEVPVVADDGAVGIGGSGGVKRHLEWSPVPRLRRAHVRAHFCSRAGTLSLTKRPTTISRPLLARKDQHECCN